MHRIDLRDSIAPLTLLKVTRAFRTLEAGGLLEVLSHDPRLSHGIDQVLQRFAHTMEVIREDTDFFRIQIRKDAPQTIADDPINK